MPGSGLALPGRGFVAREMDFCQEVDLSCQEIEFLPGKWPFARKWTWFVRKLTLSQGSGLFLGSGLVLP